MAIEVTLSFDEASIEDIKKGLLEIYPNESELPDDVYLLTLPSKILTDLVKQGLDQWKRKQPVENPVVNVGISVILPDGTIVTGE